MNNMKYLNIFLVIITINTISGQSMLEVEGRIETERIIRNQWPNLRAVIRTDTTLNYLDTIALEEIWLDSMTTGYHAFDYNNNFDPTTGTFTVPFKGIYKVNLTIEIETMRFLDDEILIHLILNDDSVTPIQTWRDILYTAGNTEPATKTLSFMTMLELNINDDIRMKVSNVTYEGNFSKFTIKENSALMITLINEID